MIILMRSGKTEIAVNTFSLILLLVCSLISSRARMQPSQLPVGLRKDRYMLTNQNEGLELMDARAISI